MGGDWNVSNVNTIQVPIRKRIGTCLVQYALELQKPFKN
jgi:hypothetical protein